METITLKFKASGQKLSADSCPQKYASNTVNYIQAEFDLDANWKSFDSVRAVWHNDFACISTVLDGSGRCTVPHEVLENLDEVHVNLVGSIVDGTELTDRLTTYPLRVAIINAEALICGTETAEVTPSQFEQYIAIVEDLVHSVKDITSCVLNADYTLTINYSDGTSDTVGPIRGAQGPQGVPGQTGNGIQSITKTGTAGLVDTYRITYTNGAHYDYTVTNGAKGETGNGIESIYLTGTSGAVKTYTILFTNGDTFEYQVTDGEVTFAALDTMLEPLLIKDTASGDIASFPDGQNVYPLRKCEVDITPVQDLNGYDSPWVGGGGKNKFDIDKLVNTADITISNGTITVTNNAKNSTKKLGEIADLVEGQTYTLTATNTGTQNLIYLYGSNASWTFGTQRTISQSDLDSLVFFYGGEGQTSVISDFMIRLSSVSDATFAPYSNICPISGRSSVGVTRTGANLFDKSTATDGKYYQLSGGNINEMPNAPYGHSALIPVKPSTSYCMTGYAGSGYYSIIALDENKKPITTWYGAASKTANFVATTPNNAKYCYLNFLLTQKDTMSLYEASAVGDFIPYNGTTTTIPLGTTVYGGTLDAVSGVLTVTHGKTIVGVDITSISGVWYAHDATFNTWGFYINIPNPFANVKLGQKPISDAFVASTGNIYSTDAPCTMGINTTSAPNGYIAFRIAKNMIGTPTDSDDLKERINAWIVANPFAIIYELATPTTIQLTPTEISTLQGNNNVWSDAGEVEVLYIADTGLYIDKKTS